MNAKETELRDLKVEWVELPTPGSGHWFLHVVVTHGNGKATELWLTKHQAAEVARAATNRFSTTVAESGGDRGNVSGGVR